MIADKNCIIITFSLLSLLDCLFVELCLKPLWRIGAYSRDVMRRYQIILFGSVFVVAAIFIDDGTLTVIQFLVLSALWLYAGVEDALYYFWLPLVARIRGVQYVEFTNHYFLWWSIPKELPWLGKHAGKWWWTSNWWLYGLSKIFLKNENVSAWVVIISALVAVVATIAP